MVFSKSKTPRCDLSIGELKINQVQNVKYTGSVLADKCDTEIRTNIGIAKDSYNYANN